MSGPFRWRLKLRAGCSRWTIPPEVILDLLSRTTGHLSPKEIYSALYPQYPGIGLPTIYRALELLQSLELVRRFRGTDGQSRSELKKGKSHYLHPHLVCTRCGRIADLPDCGEEMPTSIRRMGKALAEKCNFLITDQNIEFLGLCQDYKKGS
ncbi:MAG: Fur family transcriptional regulator [Candidatus Aminicenantales bacterium]